MFKNATFFKIDMLPSDAAALSEAMAASIFAPTMPTQVRSAGWVPPRGEKNGALLETIGTHWIMRLMTETRAVPAAALNKRVDEMAAALEQETGRKPGKKVRRVMKDEALLEMLPKAFPKQAATMIWIDRDRARVVVDTASQARADDAITALVQTMPGFFKVDVIQTVTSPAASMRLWLADEAELSTRFSIGRRAELKATDDTKAVVRYVNKSLDTDEVRGHLKAGMEVTKLEMDRGDKVEFVLTATGALHRLGFHVDNIDSKEGETAFDADMAITTGELQATIDDLIDEMGGENAPA